MMRPEEYLGGRVRKWRLPIVSPGPEADLHNLKRLALAQGELAQVYDADEGIRYIACIELTPGSIRGNHWHKFKSEWVYVLSGATELLVKEADADLIEIVRLAQGDLAYVSTGVVHALRVTATGKAIEFSPARFDPKDIYRQVLTAAS